MIKMIAMTIEEQENLLQSMSVKELLKLEESVVWKTNHHNDDETYITDVEYSVQVSLVQEPPAPKLRKLIGLSEKMAKTGLTQAQIKRIETDKSKASLSEIMLYCKGLNIEFVDFLPELFQQI